MMVDLTDEAEIGGAQPAKGRIVEVAGATAMQNAPGATQRLVESYAEPWME